MAKRKLKCKQGNYQCGGRCQSSKKRCRVDPGAEANRVADDLFKAMDKAVAKPQAEPEAVPIVESADAISPLTDAKKLAITPELRQAAADSIAKTPPTFMTKKQAKEWDKTARLESMINGYAKQQVNFMATQVFRNARADKAIDPFNKLSDKEKRAQVAKGAINEVLYSHDAFTKTPNEVFSGLFRKLVGKSVGRDVTDDTEFWGSKVKNKGTLANSKRITKENAKAFQAATAYNQEYTRQQLGDNFTLSRGITGQLANDITSRFPDAKPGDIVELPINALSSWSPSADEARRFANDEFGLGEGTNTQKGYVLEADFDIADVVYNSDTATHFTAKETYNGRKNFEIAIASGKPVIKVRIAEVV